MMRELAHRGRNLLAVIQSIAGLTLTGERSLAEARELFTGRLKALANTYGSLTDEAFEGAPLDQIISGELKAFGEQVHVGGPRIMLTAKVAQTFGMVVHELATNAVKYGALSTPKGVISIHWRLAGEGETRQLQFEWSESGGPKTQPPTRRGFGSTLISTIADGEFKTTPQIDYGEAGFRYRFGAQLSALGSAINESPVRQKLKSETLRNFYDAWAGLGGPDGRLPSLPTFDRGLFAESGALTIAEVAGDNIVGFLKVGQALTERLGRPLNDRDLASDDEESIKEAYRRCARGTAPCYERVRFNFGGGDVVTFERLLLPFSRDGKHVTHIAGLVVYSGETRPPIH